jgi:hypothetical protein
MRKRTTAVLVAGAALALLTGCATNESAGKVASLSSSNPPTSSSAPAGGGGDQGNADDLDKIRAYAKCMREHGVDMPDPDSGGGRAGGIKGDPNDPKIKTAMAACKSLLPNGGAEKPMDPAEQDKWHKRAQCMRDHGVHMQEPGPGKELELGSPEDDPAKVEAAMKACGIEIG